MTGTDPEMITTIVFDYGGVITEKRRSRCFGDWAHMTFGTSKHSVESLFDSGHFDQYMRGKIDKHEFFSRFREFGIEADVDVMSQQLVECNAPRVDMEQFVESLFHRFRLGLISDSTPELSKDVRERFGRIFQVLIFSDEQGYIKDDRVLYDIAFSKLGVDPANCIFIDDREEKLEYPRSKGAVGIHFRGIDQLQMEIRAACGG